MKKESENDGMRAEYDFSKLRGWCEGKVLLKSKSRLYRGFMICFWSGLAWALWGFYNWYIKIQRPQGLWLKAKGDLEKS